MTEHERKSVDERLDEAAKVFRLGESRVSINRKRPRHESNLSGREVNPATISPSGAIKPVTLQPPAEKPFGAADDVTQIQTGNLIQPGLAQYYADHVHQMTASVVQRHYVNHQAQIDQCANGALPLTNADKSELAESLVVLGRRLDELVPKMAAGIDDHDKLNGNKARSNWPVHKQEQTLKIHLHFCELLDSWNFNPRKRQESLGNATVDEYAETQGKTRFVFCTIEARNDFIEMYQLEDFVVATHDPNVASAYYFLELANQFSRDDANNFLDVYRQAVNTLAVLNEESQRAIRNDGGKVGFVTCDHYVTLQTFELSRISLARQTLGATRIERS